MKQMGNADKFTANIVVSDANASRSNISEQLRYREEDRIVANQMRGHKIQISQHRQKLLLKNQIINNHNSIRVYLNSFNNEIYFSDVDQPRMQDSEFENLCKSQRPKTTGILTADPVKSKRKSLQQDLDVFKNNRTMMVTSSGTRPKSLNFRPKAFFNSNNLDKKTNEYMNLVIQNQNTQPNQHEKIMSQLHIEGMIPHTRRINSFERQMKKGRKIKSLSKQKNTSFNSIDLKQINKTLENKIQTRGPLIDNLSLKTSWGPLGINNSTKRQYFHRSDPPTYQMF